MKKENSPFVLTLLYQSFLAEFLESIFNGEIKEETILFL